LAGNWHKALEDLDRFCGRGEASPEALLLRGDAHREVGQYSEAVRDYEEALRKGGADWDMREVAEGCLREIEWKADKDEG